MSAWKTGEPFASDPPNAALAIEGADSQEVVIVTLNAVSSDGAGTFQYDVTVVSGEPPATTGNVALFVDLLMGLK